MTPKEKANQLVDKFDNFNVLGENHNGFTAQQCALITVDEILSNSMFFADWGMVHFWQQVKQEIEKL
jgi:hypothetical protein